MAYRIDQIEIISKAATGAVTLADYGLTFAKADDYRCWVLEGVGSIDTGSRTATDFDVTVTTGPLIVAIAPVNGLSPK